tara:strand:- start:11 stop:409 length:399 start_codon:yes stop_codon:yes gene_type:complete
VSAQQVKALGRSEAAPVFDALIASSRWEHKLKVFLSLVVALLVSSCANVTSTSEGAVLEDRVVENEKEVSISRRIYYFQHKLIPKWVFESDGAFYFDIYNRNAERLLAEAADIISQEYSDGIRETLINRSAI